MQAVPAVLSDLVVRAGLKQMESAGSIPTDVEL